MLKSRLFFAVLFSVLISSCGSEETLTPEQESQKIEEYISSKKLIVTEKTSSGLRYILTKANTAGVKVAKGQTIYVNYTGRLLTDKQFDAGNFSFVLGSGGAITGFEEGIAKMKIGEKTTLIFPSALGYGSKGSGSSIPGYSPLVFDIEVISAK
ncbi:MAG: FKBP-type peptidyl-prolyl cis-trans isomerase [Arcicella sp.]|nr:FKBP-type peptidyl-prolyl cis-trans isomerase [Arcicella sp.]